MNRRLISLALSPRQALARVPRLALVLTILSGLLAGWLTIGQARGMSLVVDGVYRNGQSLSDVMGWLVILVGVIGLRAILAWLTEIFANEVAARVKTDLRERLFAKIRVLGPSFTQGERTGDLVSAAVEAVETLDAYFSQYLPQLVLAAVVPLSVVVFVLPLDLLSGVVLLVTAPLIPIFMILIGKGAEGVTRRQYETLARLSAHFLDSLQGLETLKQFGRSRAHARTIREASERFRDVTLGVLRVTFLSALALELIATLSTAVVAVEVGLRLLYGNLPFDKALFLLILAPEFYIPLRLLGLRFHAGMAGTTAARRIFELLDQPEVDIVAPAMTKRLEGGFQSLALRGVSYAYPDGVGKAVDEISCELKAGEHVALVGPSGAGKSTLAALMLGFIHAQAGEMRLNGLLVEEIALEERRGLFAWVPQNPHLFHDSMAFNLLMARPAASRAEMEQAAKAAHLHEFITSLPEGYETVIGEGGARLSGGQAQRLALGRAFLKGAPILILDEPTSNLDGETEREIEDSIRPLMAGRTVLTIAHRLNTVRGADRIWVMEGGRIVESGRPAVLAGKQGLFARLVAAAREGVPFEADRPKDLTGLSAEPHAGEPVQALAPESQPVARQGGWANLLMLVRFLKGSWGKVALSVGLGSATIGASVGLMGASAWLISTAANQPSIAEISVAVVGVRFFGIARGVARYFERLVSHGVTFDLLARLRTWFYEKLEPLAPARLARYRVGDLLDRIVADVDGLEAFYVRAVAPPLVAVVVSGFIALFLGQYGAGLGWAHLGFALILGGLVPALSWALNRKPGAELGVLRSALRVGTVDLVQGLADLLALGGGDRLTDHLRGLGAKLAQVQRRMAKRAGLASAAGVLFSNLGMWTVLVLCIPAVNQGRLDGVMMAVLALMALASFESVQSLPVSAHTLATSLASAGRLSEIVAGQEQAVVVTAAESMHLPAHPELGIANLTFTYPGEKRLVLRGLHLALGAGQKVAIVGASGSGKTTLVRLLLRFWQAPPGTMALGGRFLEEIPEEQVRAQFSVISQRTTLFNASIGDNMRLARPEASQGEVEQAARLAGLQEFIQSLPEGYATLVGERGLRLSGGERQRVAIARAILKNAPIFLFDEPTTNLDALTEQALVQNLFAISAGRSLLWITHRFTGLEKMDEIVVLENGQVVERGTQAELLVKGGAYARMLALQRNALDDQR